MPLHVANEPDDLVGTTLDGRYHVEAMVGRGGMGAVYRARHVLMNQRVAVKVLRPDLATDASAARRFVREAKSAFRFDHPNCVRVSDLGVTPSGIPYLVMEYLDGRTVGDEIHYDGPFSSLRVAHIARQVCDALSHAHQLSLVHRDLKPDNIMLLPRGGDQDFTKVFDFGLAKLFDQPEGGGTSMFSMAALTQEGTIFGTPEYMSPEQATGQPLDPRSDLYAVGVIMYEMLTGSLPFKGGTYMATLTAHVKERPVPPIERRPDLGIAPALDTLVMRCLAKRADKRPQTAAEMAATLRDIAEHLATRTAGQRSNVAHSATIDLTSDAAAAVVAARQHAPTEAVTVGPTDQWLQAQRRRQHLRWGLAAVLVGAIVVTVAVLASGSDDENTSASAGPETSAPPGPSAAALPVPVAAVSPGRDAGSSAPAQASVDAAAPDAAPPTTPPPPTRRTKPRARPRTNGAKTRAAPHVIASEAARRSGNTLKQIAEAHSALGIDRRNRRAAYLLGDGLIRSGDKANGCKYLRRARGYAPARKRAASAGCPR